jgi:hypothetical protein
MIRFRGMKQAHKPKDYVIICNSHHFQDNSNKWASHYLNIYILICVHLTLPSVAEFVQHGGIISTHVHTYIHSHVYIHTYGQTHRHTHMHTYMHLYKHTCIHTYVHAYVHTHVHKCTYIHTYIHIYIHTYIYIICTYVYIITYSMDLKVCQNDSRMWNES